jgi:hypothetical protein
MRTTSWPRVSNIFATAKDAFAWPELNIECRRSVVIPTRILLPSLQRKKIAFNPHKAALKTRTQATLANPAQNYQTRVGIQWKVPLEKERI